MQVTNGIKLDLKNKLKLAIQESTLEKILIVCQSARNLIGEHFDNLELLEIGITKQEILKSNKTPDLEAIGIYFCVPTPDSLASIIADFKSQQKYREFHLIWLGIIPYQILIGLVLQRYWK